MNSLGAAIVILSAWRWAQLATSLVQSVSETSRASFDVAHSEDNIAFGGANCRRSSSLSKSAYPWSTWPLVGIMWLLLAMSTAAESPQTETV